MNNCKVCGNEIKHSASFMLEGFCSEKCFWDYDDLNGKNLVEFSETDLIQKKQTKWARRTAEIYNSEYQFPFERVLKRQGYFIISQKSIDEIFYGITNGNVVQSPKVSQFNDFLSKNGYFLQKLHKSDHLIIKKCAI